MILVGQFLFVSSLRWKMFFYYLIKIQHHYTKYAHYIFMKLLSLIKIHVQYI